MKKQERPDDGFLQQAPEEFDTTEEAPGTEAVSADPMSEIFGSAGAMTFKNPENDTSAPEEVLYAFMEHGLQERSYTCVLKNARGNNVIVKSFNSCYPSIEWIQKNCGPGQYTMDFMWRASTDGKKRNFKTEKIHITLDDSPENRRIYKNFQLDAKLRDLKSNREKIRDTYIDKILESDLEDVGLDIGSLRKQPDGKSVQELAAEQLKQSMELARVMMPQPPEQRRGLDWERLAPLLLPMITGVMKVLSDNAVRREEQNMKMLGLITGISNNNQAQLVEILKRDKPQSNQDMMREVMDMIKTVVDFKQVMNPEKESLADKIFSLVESVAPHIAAVVSTPRQMQAVDPRVQIARQFVENSPDFQQLQQPENHAEMVKFVGRLDEFFGWEQADQVLAVMTAGSIERPAECPRMPEQRYPAGDPRNGTTADTPEPAEQNVD